MEISYAKVFQDRTGGCNEGSRNKQCYETIHNLKNFLGYEKYKGCEFNYRVIDYKSINNNCGLVCLIKALDLKANEFKPDSIRKEFGIELKTFIDCDKLGDVANLKFQCNLVVVNLAGFVLFNSSTEHNKTMFLLLDQNHYRHISFEDMKIKKNCEQCGKSIFFDDSKHECNINRLEYFRSQIKKDVKFLMLNDNRYIKKIM